MGVGPRGTNMQVIFVQDVPRIARAGDVLKVANGYARNYLIPQGLAAVVTPEVLKRIQKIKTAGDQRRAKETGVVEELAQILDNTSITVTGRVTPTGRYYGTIGVQKIAAALEDALGREIDRKLLQAIEPIREPGASDVVLRLPGDVQATIHIDATAEE